ncbi:MAG: hypothetical protein AB8E15_05635 [Bdellovibrionales bacterium]
MGNKKYAKLVASYFYYILPHELLSCEASVKAYRKFKKQVVETDSNEEIQIKLIGVCRPIAEKYYQKYSKEKKKLEGHLFSSKIESLKSAYIRPIQLDMGPWRQLARESNFEDLDLLIWHQILGIPKETVAYSLLETRGTIHLRLSKSLSKLSLLVQPGRKEPSTEGGANA